MLRQYCTDGLDENFFKSRIFWPKIFKMTIFFIFLTQIFFKSPVFGPDLFRLVQTCSAAENYFGKRVVIFAIFFVNN